MSTTHMPGAMLGAVNTDDLVVCGTESESRETGKRIASEDGKSTGSGNGGGEKKRRLRRMLKTTVSSMIGGGLGVENPVVVVVPLLSQRAEAEDGS
jgi:hypothetical protein